MALCKSTPCFAQQEFFIGINFKDLKKGKSEGGQFLFIFPSSCSLFRQSNIVFFLEAFQTLLELGGVAFGVLAALIFAHDGFEEISVSDQGGNNVGREMRAMKLAGFVLLQKF